MPKALLFSYVSRVREFLRSPEGRRYQSGLMAGQGWPYERVVGKAIDLARNVCAEKGLKLADPAA